MTLRTGKGSRYRYYTCSIKARQGETGCKGRSIPMAKLDELVANHIADRLLAPDRLEEVLAYVLDRRQERSERCRHHVGELKKRASEADARLKRLYDAIEGGVADLDDPDLRERIASLKATRDQARSMPSAPRPRFRALDRRSPLRCLPRSPGLPVSGCGSRAAAYRRDHLRALAQRVEVADTEVRIMGWKSNLLGTLVAASGGKMGTPGVRSSVLNWRRGCPLNSALKYLILCGSYNWADLSPIPPPIPKLRL